MSSSSIDFSGDIGGLLSNDLGGISNASISKDSNDLYFRYLPTAQKMLDSFQITSINTDNSTSEPIKPAPSQCQDLLAKLNARLVSGEINAQQYDEIRHKIGC